VRPGWLRRADLVGLYSGEQPTVSVRHQTRRHQDRYEPLEDLPRSSGAGPLEVSRFLLVEMEEDLRSRYTTHDGVLISCKCVNGVKAVTDLECISRATLDEWLLPEHLSLMARPRKRER
jgi:hypothetical protein